MFHLFKRENLQIFVKVQFSNILNRWTEVAKGLQKEGQDWKTCIAMQNQFCKGSDRLAKLALLV